MDLNSVWIRKSLEYHGLPLKSTWDGERGEAGLQCLGLTTVDYSTYRNRSKRFGGLAERRVRSKLHQFIAKNAPALFDNSLLDSVSSSTPNVNLLDRGPFDHSLLPTVYNAPPFECFLEGLGPIRRDRVYETIRVGDLLYVRNSRLLCIEGHLNYCIADLQVRVAFPTDFAPHKVQGPPYTCFEVESVDRRYNYIQVKFHKDRQPKKLPEFYTLFEKAQFRSYQEYFDRSEEFKKNHNCANLLYPELDLDIEENYSNMASARGRYPPQEYAEDIRQKQASKLAFR